MDAVAAKELSMQNIDAPLNDVLRVIRYAAKKGLCHTKVLSSRLNAEITKKLVDLGYLVENDSISALRTVSWENPANV